MMDLKQFGYTSGELIELIKNFLHDNPLEHGYD